MLCAVCITVIPIVKKCPKNQILSENISFASIYSSQVTEVHFCVKNSYFLNFHQISNFCAGLPYELQENLAFNDQYSLFWPILLKFMVLHIRVIFLNKKNMKMCSPIFTSENYDFFSEIFH